jgi:hypothetical protein
MKTFLLAILVCAFTLSTQAQIQIKIINNTHCDFKITPSCYDPMACVGGPCAGGILSPAGSSVPGFKCICGLPKLPGFTVCYVDCPGLCVNVGDPSGPCPAWPYPGMLPPCPACDNVPHFIFYNSNGDLVIQ